MKQSYKILTLFGIDIEVHWLFVLTIAIFLFVSPTSALLFGIIFIFVALHEIAHSLVAKSKNVNVKKIILIPIGGMAMIENIEDLDPISEIKMAFAGPLLNFIVVGLCILGASIAGYPLLDKAAMFLTEEVEMGLGELIFVFIFYANAMLGLFNLLIPAFPMDGGRIFRGLLALKMDYIKATDIARKAGIIFGAGLGLFGFFGGNLFLGVIGIFIILGANAEYQNAVLSKSLNEIDKEKLITNEVFMFDGETPINEVVRELIQSRGRNALIDEKKVFDISYLQGVPQSKWSKPVKRVSKKLSSFQKKESLIKISKRMSEKGYPFVKIKSGRKTLGIIYLSDIQKQLQLKQYGIQN